MAALNCLAALQYGQSRADKWNKLVSLVKMKHLLAARPAFWKRADTGVRSPTFSEPMASHSVCWIFTVSQKLLELLA
jgi:hypothetical protein